MSSYKIPFSANYVDCVNNGSLDVILNDHEATYPEYIVGCQFILCEAEVFSQS